MDNNKKEIIEKISTVLSAVLKQSIESDEGVCRENTPAWDSLKHIDVMFTLEEEFNTQFSEEQLGELTSIGKIAEAIIEQHAS